jgi:hypothetical protein
MLRRHLTFSERPTSLANTSLFCENNLSRAEFSAILQDVWRALEQDKSIPPNIVMALPDILTHQQTTLGILGTTKSSQNSVARLLLGASFHVPPHHLPATAPW